MDKFTARDPNYKKKVMESFARQGFMHFIGATLSQIAPGYCEIDVQYKPELTQQHGFFHAGVVGTIADNVAGYAAFTLMEETSSILTVEYKINLISPAKGDLLTGRGRVIKSGKTLTLCQSDVFILNNGKENQCAAAQVTLMNIRNSPDTHV